MRARFTEQTTVQLSEDMKTWLKGHAAATGQKLSDSIRDMITLGIREHQRKVRQLP